MCALYYVSEMAEFPAIYYWHLARRSNSPTSSKELFKLVGHYPKIGKMKHHTAVTSKPRAQKTATVTSSEFVIKSTSRRPAGFAASPRRWGFSKGKSSRLIGPEVIGPLLLWRPTNIQADCR
jgi:hypothetical protein